MFGLSRFFHNLRALWLRRHPVNTPFFVSHNFRFPQRGSCSPLPGEALRQERRSKQSLAEGPDDGTDAGVNPQFAVDIPEVRVHCVRADKEPLRNFLLGMVFNQKMQNLALSGGQAMVATRADVAAEETNHRLGNGRTYGRAVGPSDLNRIDDLLAGCGPEQAPTCASTEKLADLVLLLACSQDDDLGGRRAPLDLPDGFDARPAWKLETHQHHSRSLVPLQGRNGVLAQAEDLCALQGWVLVNRRNEPRSAGRVAVHNPDGSNGAASGGGSRRGET